MLYNVLSKMHVLLAIDYYTVHATASNFTWITHIKSDVWSNLLIFSQVWWHGYKHSAEFTTAAADQ